MLIDLQLHSTFSDGYLSPSELVDFAKERSIKVISLTDHHTTAGLEEFRQAAKELILKLLMEWSFILNIEAEDLMQFGIIFL